MGTEGLVPWGLVKGLSRSHLDKLVELHEEQKMVVEAATEKLDVIKTKLLNALVGAGVEKVAVGETRVTVVAGGTSEKLDKKKLRVRLLELGVKEPVVKRAFKDCTTKEPREPHILVTPPKGGVGG